MPKFFLQLADKEKITHQQEQIDTQVRLNRKPSKLEERVYEAAKKIWQKIEPKLKDPDNLAFGSDALKEVAGPDPYLGYLKTRLNALNMIRPRKNDVIRELATRSRTTKKEKPPGEGRRKIPIQYLNTRVFLNNLSLYLYARTGLSFEYIGLKLKQEDKHRNNPVAFLKGVRLADIDLGRLHGKGLDTFLPIAVAKTWPDVALGKNTAPGPKPKISIQQATSAKSKARLEKHRRAAKDKIQEIGKSKDFKYILLRDRFAFNKAFRREVEEALVKPSLSKDKMPKWDDFVSTTPPKPDSTGVTPFVGMHVRTHGYFTKENGAKYGESVTGRQSHHTTQFLLPEYFHNAKSFKPFDPKRKMPGVKWSGENPVGF